MEVIRAKHAGACYGVQRALDLAQSCIDEQRDATTLGALIHNPQVVAALSAAGIHAADQVEDVTTGTVIIRSHGVTPQAMDKITARGLDVVDATCPHVSRAQKSAARLAADGLLVVVVGEEGHPEVEGMRAYAEREGGRVLVVHDAADVPTDLPAEIGVVVQTTQMAQTLDQVLAAIRSQGIEPEVKNTICFATTQRQEAASDLASQVDAMVVIGGRNSSNTTRLSEICAEACPRTYHIEATDVLDPAWFAGCQKVGVTAGASTPEEQIEHVVSQLEQM